MSGFGDDVEVGVGSLGNSANKKNRLQVRDQEKDSALKMVQLVDENTALYKNGDSNQENQEKLIPMAPGNSEDSTPKSGFESETRAEKEKKEKTRGNSFLRPSVILNFCLVLVNFVLVAVVMSRTSEISCSCSNGDVSAFVNQTKETKGAGAGKILDEMKLELGEIKEWRNSTEEQFESQRLLIQSLLNQTKVEEQLESLEKENEELKKSHEELKKSHEELKDQFESLSQNFEVLESNISSISHILLVTPAPAVIVTQTTPAPPSKSVTSCSDAVENLPSPRSKKQTIYPHGNRTSVEVLCDFESDGGGWTIIQKRTSGPKQDFVRNWNEYSNGFGSLDGNFWMGLENIHALTKNRDQELRIELEDFEGEKRWAKYSSFSISDASDFYRLSISGFSGTVNDSIASSLKYGSGGTLNGMRFTTKDRDNDNWSKNCAVDNYGAVGGWWFNQCTGSNLNGLYYEKGETVGSYPGVLWCDWKEFYSSLAKSEMKIRQRKS